MSKRSRSATQGATPVNVPVNPYAFEQFTKQIQNLVGDRTFGSEAEMQAFLDDLLTNGRLEIPEPETPLEKAQLLAYAGAESDGDERVELFVRALAHSTDCADAWAGLATSVAMDPDESLALLQRAIEVGEKAIPAEVKERGVPYWLDVGSRPYMRARFSLAIMLVALDRASEAISQMNDLLRLNPGDEQGVRYLLLPTLVSEGRYDDATRLVAKFADDAETEWLFDRALLAFCRNDNSRDRALDAAVDSNAHVIPYLIGTKKVPAKISRDREWGSREEAADYASMAIARWRSVPGAIEWLRTRMRPAATR